MPSLLVFYRVYRLEIQSVMLVFSTGFVNYCPSTLTLLSGYCSPPPPSPLPCVKKFTVFTYTVCNGGGGGGIWGHGRGGGGPQTDETPAAKSSYRSIFYITTFGIAFYQSNLSTCTYNSPLSIGWARIFKCLWGPGIDSKEWIPPAYVAWRAGTITLFLLGS